MTRRRRPPDPSDVLQSPEVMRRIGRYVFGKARQITGEADNDPPPLCMCLTCGQAEPVDELGRKVMRELSLAFDLREVAELLVLVCSCGGEGCICPECVEVAHGRELGATTRPCPKLAKLGTPRARGPEA